MITEQPLLELLSAQMGCEYLSDLLFLSPVQRLYLADRVSRLIPREKELREWNDALMYLTGAPPERTAWAAKRRLEAMLRGG